jgi:hypothetical protein
VANKKKTSCTDNPTRAIDKTKEKEHRPSSFLSLGAIFLSFPFILVTKENKL